MSDRVIVITAGSIPELQRKINNWFESPTHHQMVHVGNITKETKKFGNFKDTSYHCVVRYKDFPYYI